MRELFFIIGLCLLAVPNWGQSAGDAEAIDTSKIYQIVEEAPLFPGCDQLEGVPADRAACTNQQLLKFVYQYLRYPEQALTDSLEGQVVAQFVVERNGTISNVKILKDIGGGCGEEVVRVVESMNGLSARWTAGKQKGEVVRSTFTLPIRFKLPKYDEPEFTIEGRDTVWLKFDTPATFKGGDAALQEFISDQLRYPSEGVADCVIGEMDVQLLVMPGGEVKIVDLLDYYGIGFDYWYEAIRLALLSRDRWEVAMYKGKPVTTTQSVRLSFAPPTAGCVQRVGEYRRALQLNEEAIALFESDKGDEAIAKWNDAIGLFSNNAEWLSFRGQAFMNAGRMGEACADLSKTQEILGVYWYSTILPILCTAGEQERADKAEAQEKELKEKAEGATGN